MTVGGSPLESGIFYVDPFVEYPLHHHKELEAFFILAGETRFVQLIDGELVYIDKKTGEWHFNHPHVPHAITSVHGKPHLSLWFREGGTSGQEKNDRMGPKCIGEVDGLDFVSQNETKRKCPLCIKKEVWNETQDITGSLGFKNGTVILQNSNLQTRCLDPKHFEIIQKNAPEVIGDLDRITTQENADYLHSLIQNFDEVPILSALSF